MKKNYALLLLSVAALTANAQQINGDFDAAWEKCVPWDSIKATPFQKVCSRRAGTWPT